MRCPFLREAQVKQCQASAYRKLIVREAEKGAGERCSSSQYVDCPAAKELREDHPSSSHCPFLQESLVQYCAASPMQKFVPYNESSGSRCATENHRYCEEYLTLAAPGGETHTGEVKSVDDGVEVPSHLHFAPNHLWLDVAEDGTCHVGVDDFLAHALGSVEEIRFASRQGAGRPSAVLRVNGVDLQLLFPNELLIGSANVHLRTKPGNLVDAPYTLGWMFEATTKETGAAGIERACRGLISGTKAVLWMTEELRLLTEFVHRRFVASHPAEPQVMNDGGYPVRGLARLLDQESLLALHNEFFSPYTTWRSL